MKRVPVIEVMLPQVQLPDWRLRLEAGTAREELDRSLPSDPQPDRELRSSLADFGQLQPIGVRATDETDPKWGPLYELVFGRRRFEQAQRLGAVIISASVIAVHPEEALMIAIQENHARRAINGAELARALSTLKRARGYPLRALAKATGLTVDRVQQLVRIDRYLCDSLREVWERYGDRLPRPARLKELAKIAALPEGEQQAEWDRLCKLRQRKNKGGRPRLSMLDRVMKLIPHLNFTEEERELVILGARLACRDISGSEVGFAQPNIEERRALARARGYDVSLLGEQHRRKVPPVQS